MPAYKNPSQKDLLDELTAIREETGIPGISVAVSQAGMRTYAHVGVADVSATAPLSDQSRFEVSCLMKLFMSLIAQKLISSGLLDSSRPIGSYLAELSSCISGQRISVGNLLSHTSGYRGVDVTDARVKWAHSWQKLIDQLEREELLFPPGQVFSYEHSEHVLLGEILRRVTGRTVDQLLNEELLEPLGIKTHRARDNQHGEAFVAQHVPAKEPRKFVPTNQPAFSEFWRASLPDMTIRLQDVLTIGEWILDETDSRFQDAVYHQVIEIPPQVTSSRRAELIPMSFGHVCGRYDVGLFGHNGSVLGQSVALRIDAAERALYVVGINAWVPHARDRVIRFASGRVGPYRKEGLNAERQAEGIAPSDLSKLFSYEHLAGIYDGGFARQVAVEAGDSGGMSMLVGAPGSRQRRITVTRRADGLCEFGPNQDVSCVFTAHPVDSSPVLHLGVHAYRKRQ
jgi:CubicO group peptidase (beta-lactamase class C family)